MVLVSDKPIYTIVLTSLIVLIMYFLHAGRQRDTLPGTEEPMITSEFITALFYEVDEQLRAIPKHPEAHLWPSEVVTLGLLHALKGGGNRAFYRWLTRDYRPLFPRLPERTRLFRVWSKNSCSLTLVVFQQSPKPFATLHWTLTRCAWADHREEQDIALALMIPLVMIML